MYGVFLRMVDPDWNNVQHPLPINRCRVEAVVGVVVEVCIFKSLQSDDGKTFQPCRVFCFGARGITYQKNDWFGLSEGLPILNMTTFEVRLENCKIMKSQSRHVMNKDRRHSLHSQ